MDNRKLDALIAEKVMGTKEFKVTEFFDKHNPENNSVTIHMPHYSTDIADAWKVVEKIQKQGIPWPFNGLFHEHCNLEELPREICIRALKAVGVVIE